MRKKSNIFLGAILVAVGVIFLGLNYDFINFDYSFRQIAAFWPVLLILAGVAVLLHERRSFYNPTTALLVAFAIPLAIYSVASDGVEEIKDELETELNFDFDDDDWDYERKKWSESGSSSERGDRTEQDFGIPYSSKADKVKLKVGGGAAEFHLRESESDVFGATTLLNLGSYQISDGLKNGVHDIEFEMRERKNKSFNFSDDNHNEVFLKLNKKPLWDIELAIGAGDLDFDLSEYKIENLEIKTGAASVDVKLGDLLDKTYVDVESGVAKVAIAVPEEVGCEIIMDGALNSKDFDGFKKEGSSTYRTDNFNSASKKIFIDVSSGLSSVSVDRY
ncbi:LiaI-LiaF-like domain-containing protein [Jiulongibacter sp. NS-SX5]|uniref:LiaI-LiaF-like domain-containing protein n=1 Tax=Jiulongibacter sp. NS-SX5 TaxID=3463854 RepID=UPI0040581B5E